MTHPGAAVAGFATTCPGGPVRSGRRLYRCLAIAVMASMLFGGLAFMPAPASAVQTETTATLDLRFEPVSNAAIVGAIPNSASANDFSPASLQTGPSLVGLLIAVLLDLRALALNAESVAPAPAGTGGDIVSIIYAAADAYGQPRADLLRVATCESNLNPGAVNGSSGASGLFQFMPGTWATTPYADQNIFDPVANANAAAWMWDVGRRGEWVCQ